MGFSNKLTMVEEFSINNFYDHIITWLKNAGSCKKIGERFEKSENKNEIQLKDGDCHIHTFIVEKDLATYNFFKLKQILQKQTWETQVVFRQEEFCKEIYIHIKCLGETTSFYDMPQIRRNIIKTFVESKY